MLAANLNSQLTMIGQNNSRKKKLDDVVARKAVEDGKQTLTNKH